MGGLVSGHDQVRMQHRIYFDEVSIASEAVLMTSSAEVLNYNMHATFEIGTYDVITDLKHLHHFVTSVGGVDNCKYLLLCQ